MASSAREPILVREMKEEKVYKRKQLSATIVGEVIDLMILFLDNAGVVSPSAVFTIADDEGRTIQVQVLHVARDGVVGIVPVHKLREMYPAGSRIIIKDPYIPSLRILVEHPAKIEVVTYFGPKKLHQALLLSAAEVRDLGNVEYRNGSFLAALKYYELGLSKVVPDHGNAVDEGEAVLGFSNKAACFLQIGDFERAYLSCCSAIKLQPDNPKVLARLGQAYLRLQEYDLAAQVLARAAELGPGEKYAAEELRQARTLAAQASSGDYGEVLKSWFLRKCDEAPEVADYIGPVEIRITAEKGRGLFATADVPAGALVLVSNAVSFERKVLQMLVVPAVVSKVFMECIKSPDLLRRVLSLPDPSTIKAVPPMTYFGANRIARGGRDLLGDEKLKNYTPDEEVDYNKIRDIVKSCAFSKYLDDGKHLYSALWLLPGFVKHSCVPNMSKLDVGSAAFFHANRDIKAGEELTFSWSTSRREKFKSKDWSCDCKRCKVEEKLFGRKLRPLAKAYQDCISGKYANDRMKLGALAPVIEEAMAAGTPEEKSLARTAFADAFVEYHLLLQRGVVAQRGKVASAEAVIRDLRDYAPGSFRTIELIRKLGVQKTRDDFKKWIGSRAVSGDVIDAIMSMTDPHFFF